MFEGAPLDVLPGYGHYPHLQEPDRVATEVLAFLGDPERPPVRLSLRGRAPADAPRAIGCASAGA